MKKLCTLALFLLLAGSAISQNVFYPPQKFLMNTTTDGVNFITSTTTITAGAVGFAPEPYTPYCQITPATVPASYGPCPVGGGGGGAVSSVFGRTGAVTAASGDYTAAQVAADRVGAAGTSSTSIVVAASNSVNKAVANVVCTGTNDDVCINNAMATACPSTIPAATVPAGCHVILQAGIYNIAAPIVIDTDDVHLSGEGHCMWGGYIHPWVSTSDPAGAIGTGCSQLRASGANFNLIELRNNNAAGTGTDTNRHRGIEISWLYLVGNNYTGTGIFNTSGQIHDNVSIFDNVIQRVADGINVSLDTGDISYNSVQDVSGRGIIHQGILGKDTHNLIYDVGGNCYQSFSMSIIISENQFGDCQGVLLSNSNHASLIGNAFTVNIGTAVSVVNSRGATITGNTFNDYDALGFFPKMPLTTDLIAFDSTSPGGVVTGNSMDTMYGMGGYAINFGTAVAGAASGNTILGPWGYGGPAINGGSSLAANAYPFVPAAGPAVITSARLQERFQASSLSALATGASIPNWPDTSGFARTLSVFSGAPKYIAASTINSGPAVRFNGTSDALTEAFSLLPAATPGRTVFAVIHISTLATARSKNISIVNSRNAATTNAFVIDSTSNDLATYAGTYTVTSGPALTTTATYVVMMVSNGAATRMSVNGTGSGTINNGTQVWTGQTFVGSSAQGGDEFFPGDISEIDVYSGAASTADAALVGAALCTSYGVTCSTTW